MQGNIARLNGSSSADSIRPIPSFEYDRPPPDVDWMVGGAFPRASVVMVSGDGAIGKSTLMQQLLTSACLGRDWLGMPCVPGRGLMFACEDDHAILLRRQRDIEVSFGIEHADLEGGVHLVARVGQDNLLATLERKAWRMRPTALFTELGIYCHRHGISYVVIDTASQVFGGNQNDERQVIDFINILRRLAIAIQGVVIITKHPSLSGRAGGSGESGSSQWNNAVRARLYMREDSNGETIISGMKANYGPKLDRIALRWQRGVFVVCEGQGVPAAMPVLSGMDLRYRLLQGLARAITAGAQVRADELHAESMARRALRSHDPSLSRVPPGRLYEAQAAMIRDGQVVIVDVKGLKLIRPANGPAYQGEGV